MLLKKGDKNEQVRQLQVKLGVDPVGTFGPKTEEAVKIFQAKHGLAADGIVGPATWDKIMGVTPVVAAPSVVVPPSSFKLDKLKGHIPDSVLAQIPDTAAKFNITNPLRLAHFLAQCGHESGGWKATSENLNYSSKGLLGIFPRYFTPALAEQYARKPEAIASRVYGGRMGNGAEATKEGFKFRGRGYIQLTGKDNYISFGQAINEDLVSNPDKVATQYPLLSAAWFFHKNKLNKIADEGSTREIVEKITRRINGGLNGIEHRVSEFSHYYRLLSE